MALLNLGHDPWIIEHDSCEKLHRDLMQQLSERHHLSRSTERYLQLSANIRMRLKQYNNEVAHLAEKLGKTSTITLEEEERRRRQLEILHSKSLQMQKLFDEQVVNKSREETRSNLFSGAGDTSTGIRYNFRQKEEDENEDEDYSVEKFRNDQKKILNEQNEGLENLAQIIKRQKDIANTISNEVDLHNEILDDLGDHMDRADIRVREQTGSIALVHSNDTKTCIYWIIIIVLFTVNLIIIVV